MRYLILSDIHANWEALEACLADAEGDYDTIICLGDVVGYGADPNAVTDWTRDNCAQVIRGNHDKVSCGIEEPLMFNPVAKLAVDWTRSQLSPHNRQYLRELPQGPVDLDEFLMVHGAISDEDEYLISMRDAMDQFPRAPGRLVLFGHTHVQGGFFERAVRDGSTADLNGSPNRLRIREGETYLVNPGSVGQPRDLIWQAGYALYDSESRAVEYRRCSYDVQTAQDKIRQAGLPPVLSERLALGR